MIPIKKWLLLYVLLVTILLVGCVDDGKKEDESVVMPSQKAGMDEPITLRPEIHVSTEFNALWIYRDKHCWEAADQQCVLEPTLPSEFLVREKFNHVKAGEDIFFQFLLPLGDLDFPHPDSFIAYVQDGDEMKPIEVSDNKIQAPLTPGKYQLSVKAIWDNELKGETIYAFTLMVKE